MRIIKLTSRWVFLLSCASSMAWGQGPALNVDVFAEAGDSSISNIRLVAPCPQGPQVCTIGNCPPSCPSAVSSSNAARLFTGVRLRTGHAAIEASYSYSPNQVAGYNRFNLFSFNYVQYLWLRSKVQPFATIGLGANRLSGALSTPANVDFAWNYGGGADIRLRRHLALRLELRDYVGGLPSTIGTNHTLVPSAGIVFRLR